MEWDAEKMKGTNVRRREQFSAARVLTGFEGRGAVTNVGKGKG